MKRYRLREFALDATQNIFNMPNNTPMIEKQKQETKKYLVSRFGEMDFDNKFKRYMEIKKPILGIVEEYWYLLNEIVDAYVSGYFYPALTGACCLGERIFNVMILKLRPYYKSNKFYKDIYNKNSFNDWKRAIDILKDWQVIDNKVENVYRSLGEIRHESVHYHNKEQDLRKITIDAINNINFIADRIFGILNRKDILLLFDVPGEIYIRKEAEKIPAVREFYIPSAFLVGYKHITTDSQKIIDEKYVDREISDEQFVNLRKSFTNKYEKIIKGRN
jgi:hypothetical protein